MFFKFRTRNRRLKSMVKDAAEYSVIGGVNLISKLDKYCKTNSISAKLKIQIFEDGDNKSVLDYTVELGHGDVVFYPSYLENKYRLLTENDVEENPQYQFLASLITRLKQEYQQQSMKREHGEKVSNYHRPLDQTKKGWQDYLEFCRTLIKNYRRSLIVAGAVIITASFGYYLLQHIPVGNPSTTKSEIQAEATSVASNERLTALLEDKRFNEALTLYPKEYARIERSIFYLGTEGIPYLEEFLKTQDYVKGRFDLAYLKRDYQTVIDLKDEADTDDRLAQLAVAFIKSNQLGEAEKLNDSLKSEAISKLIFLAKENHAIELIKKGSVDEARAIQDQINSEKLKSYFEQYDALSSAIAEGQSTLESSDLSDESKAAVESAKTQNEDSLKQLNDNLK